MRSWYCIGLVIAATLASPSAASAQRQSAAGIQRLSASTERIDAVTVGPRAVSAASARGVAHGALIGAGVGAAAGLLVAAIAPHSSSADNGEAYIAFGAIGAFVGMVAGAAIGASRW
jgi:hypothetical protein